MSAFKLVCLTIYVGFVHGSITYTEQPHPMAEFQLGSQYCEHLRMCDGVRTFPETNCYCDELCYLMEDCCENIATFVPDRPNYRFDKSQFSCDRVIGLMKDVYQTYGVLLVSMCSVDWTDNTTKSLCEEGTNYFGDEIHLRTPVSDSNQIMYTNMYCAYCNYEYDIKFWIPEFNCSMVADIKEVRYSSSCKINFNQPSLEYDKRLCSLDRSMLISDCGYDNDPTLISNCTYGPFNTVYDYSYGGNMYRNKYCAMCNGINVSETTLWCFTEGDRFTLDTSDSFGGGYSFRLLIDFNNGALNINGKVKQGEESCQENEIYDVLYDTCREIICVAPAIPLRGRCVVRLMNFDVTRDLRQERDNCTWVKFSEGEYRLVNDSKLFILAQDKVYESGEYTINGTDVFICLDRNQSCLHDCDTPDETFNFDEAEGLVSMIGLIISITSLSFTFIIYVSFSAQLMNTPGKILICLIVSLLLAQLLFLISPEVKNIRALCTAIAIAIHYFFLAAFCWMNVIAFDLWMTFSNSFLSNGSSNRSGKRLRMYHIYAWLFPLLIVCAAVALDFSTFNIEYTNLKPSYGSGLCWISSRDALLLFFIGPLSLFKLVDIISFIFTAYHIAKAKRQSAMARKQKNTCNLLINIKLSLVMGLTWVFAFVANATNLTVLWYMFIVFNTLQGLFIALSFLCTKKVGRLLLDRYAAVISSFSNSSSSGTQITSASHPTY